MKFSYQARTKDGTIKKGVLEASSKMAAIDLLHKNNFYPTLITEESKKLGLDMELKFLEKGVSQKEVVMFTRELAIMIESNVPPAKALEALADQTSNKAFKEKILKIAADIREGITMSKAFAKYPKVFSSFYANMIKSGEVSGTLPEVLKKVADHLENEYYIRTKTIGAMVYPIVILVVFSIIFVVIVVYVIPGLVEVLESSGAELPLVTRVVIGVSNFVINFWWFLILIIAGIVSFLYYYPKTPEGKKATDVLVLNIPIYGKFQKNIMMNRFAENFGTLLTSGKPITEALEVTADLIGNVVYRDLILETREGVVKGQKVSENLVRYPKLISPLFVQMVAVGETTGRISETLINVVKFYKTEIETFVDSISSLIEPIMILGLAGMVGVLVAAVFLPLYQIGGTIG
ncbi:MAG: type II secretion system F family protein [Candidatus Pacebacteria bacterium]|nr:type II secretion system F family protein [Candidatus Paceibacterota bacterium]MDD3919289.1 type II secretion system F family protein [Candidatus Paceibacterota bacterium]